MTQTVSPVFQAATEYMARGWRVIPVNRDKSPATRNGFKDATSDPNRWTTLWVESRGAGVGIQTGAESGIVVLDIDPDKGGRDSLAALVERQAPLPTTVETCTGGGGTHLYFKHRGSPIRNSAGQLGPGLDVRGDGGYVVAPPSPHASGTPYTWKEGRSPGEIAVAEMPEWLAARLEVNAAPPASPDTGAESECIPEGERNSRLTSIAGSLRRNGLDAAAIEPALIAINRERCDPLLDDAEVAKIAASIGKRPASAEAERMLEIVSAKALCQRPDPPESDLLVGPLLVRGNRTVLAAQTGHGKTTLALRLVRALVAEEDFLGWTGVGGRVLVLDAEQGTRTIKRRLRETGLTSSNRVDYVQAPDGLALDRDGPDVAQIEAALDVNSYDLIVADPLYKLHLGDSNEERQAVDLMRRLDRWRTDYGVGLLLLTHRRKSQFGSKGFTMDDIFGSTAFVRGAEVVLGLQRTAPGYSHLHFFKDRDGDLPVGARWGLLFERESGFRRDPEDGKPRETATDRLRVLLIENPDGLTLQQLAQLGDCTDKTARKAMRDLGAESTTGPNGTKTWRLPSEGQDQ